MKRKRHSPEQIIGKRRDADRMLSDGEDLAAVFQALAVSEATFHRRRNQYGGMKADEAKRHSVPQKPTARPAPRVRKSRVPLANVKPMGSG